MKHIKLFEDFINEKAYQMTGHYGAKGIPGKVLFAFKKEIEKIKYEGDADETLKHLNDVWKKWGPKEGAKIIEHEVMKIVKDKEAIVFVTASLKRNWQADDINGLNKPDSSELYVRLPEDFVINIGFADDVDANKFAKKLGGMTNSPIDKVGDVDVIGSFDPQVDENNVEIRESLMLSIDAK